MVAELLPLDRTRVKWKPLSMISAYIGTWNKTRADTYA